MAKKKNNVLDIVIIVFFFICILLLAFVITQKKSDDGIGLFGYEARVVLSESMDNKDKEFSKDFEIKSFEKDALLTIKKVPKDDLEKEKFYESIKVGDVLTFKYVIVYQEVITHRVTNIEKVSGGYKFTLRGDNASESEIQIIDTSDSTSYNYIIGKVTHVNKVAGNIVTFVSSKVGILLCIILPASLVLIFEIVKISSIITKEKVKLNSTSDEEQEEIKRLMEEIERLKSDKNNNNVGDE